MPGWTSKDRGINSEYLLATQDILDVNWKQCNGCIGEYRDLSVFVVSKC